MIYLGDMNPDTKGEIKRKWGRKCQEIVEGMCYHPSYYFTESLRHRIIEQGREKRRFYLPCFSLLPFGSSLSSDIHFLCSLDSGYPLGWLLRKSGPTLCKEVFISSCSGSGWEAKSLSALWQPWRRA